MSRDDAPEDLIINPMDSLLDTDFGPLPVTPTGEFVPATAVYESDPIPAATEENFICLRGPCKNYFEMRPYFSAGNTKGTLDHTPVMIKRTCMRITGYEIDLMDEVVADCNGWDPLLPADIEGLNYRREQYFQIRKSKENAQ